jgi:hypothetical protein
MAMVNNLRGQISDVLIALAVATIAIVIEPSAGLEAYLACLSGMFCAQALRR